MTAAARLCRGVLALGVVGCAHARPIDAQLADLAAITREAREDGAYHCAPEELARAEAELDFARAELALGDPARAQEHVVRASANARAALRMSAGSSCADPNYRLRDASPEASSLDASEAERLSMTQPSRCGSTTEDAAI